MPARNDLRSGTCDAISGDSVTYCVSEEKSPDDSIFERQMCYRNGNTGNMRNHFPFQATCYRMFYKNSKGDGEIWH